MSTAQSVNDYIYAAEAECDKLEDYLKEHLKGSKVLAVAEGLNWDNPKEYIALSVAIESITGIALERGDDDFTLKEAAKGTLKFIGKAFWMLVKGIVTLIGIILKALGGLLMKVGEIDKWVADASVKVKKKTEEVIVDTAEKIQERELKKAVQESIDVKEGLISKVFNLDSLRMTLTEDDAKIAHMLVGINAAKQQWSIDTFLNACVAGLQEDSPSKTWVNHAKELVSKYMSELNKAIIDTSKALQSDIKSNSIDTLRHAVPTLVRVINDATEKYLHPESIDQDGVLNSSFKLGFVVEGKADYQKDNLNIPGIFQGEYSGKSTASYELKETLDYLPNTKVNIEGSKTKYNADTYAQYGRSMGDLIADNFEKAIKEFKSFKPTVENERKLVVQAESLLKNLASTLKASEGLSNQETYNKVLQVLNDALRIMIQLMKILNIQVQYFTQATQRVYGYAGWIITVWRAGSGVTTGHAQEQE